LLPSYYPRAAYSQGKLVIKPSPSKVIVKSPSFLHIIYGDICGPIHPPCRPFRYFMILIDVSTRWSHVCLLSTRNITFASPFTQIIRLQAQFSDYPIQSIQIDKVQVNSHLKHFMIIACQLELMLNILLLMHILKMV
jgi:hypothetical protein